MFSSLHAIWKFAFVGDELDDWLPHAEWLIEEWSAQSSDEVQFCNTFDVILAALLLQDNLLPASARTAFANLMLEVIDEATVNKLRVNCLHITPPKPGRKNDLTETFIRFHEVKAHIQKGSTASEAYQLVAEAHSKSVDTIRRAFERKMKKIREREKTGENKK